MVDRSQKFELFNFIYYLFINFIYYLFIYLLFILFNTSILLLLYIKKGVVFFFVFFCASVRLCVCVCVGISAGVHVYEPVLYVNLTLKR